VHVIEPVGTGFPLLPDTVAVYEYVVPVTLPVTDRFGTPGTAVLSEV
jgi:hypothetical protein